jgi:hypothetical protein
MRVGGRRDRSQLQRRGGAEQQEQSEGQFLDVAHENLLMQHSRTDSVLVHIDLLNSEPGASYQLSMATSDR